MERYSRRGNFSSDEAGRRSIAMSFFYPDFLTMRGEEREDRGR